MFEQSNLVTMDVHFAQIAANGPQAKIGQRRNSVDVCYGASKFSWVTMPVDIRHRRAMIE